MRNSKALKEQEAKAQTNRKLALKILMKKRKIE